MKQTSSEKQTRGSVFLFTAAGCLIMSALLAVCVNGAGAISFDQQELQQQQQQTAGKTALSLAVIESPELVARVLESLLRSVVYSSSVDQLQANPQKRGLDLGISRGFSGSQAGKHLMGLSAASFANGPGRR